MVSGRLFEILEYVARTVRRSQLPFGGIQLILCGDFHQLPPVDRAGGFAFECAAWHRCVAMHLLLPGNFRHRDGGFAALLSRVRVARCNPADLAWLAAADDDNNSPSARDVHNAGKGGDTQAITSRTVQATVLYAANRDVDSVNGAELERLPGPALRFRAVDEGLEDALKVLRLRRCLLLSLHGFSCQQPALYVPLSFRPSRAPRSSPAADPQQVEVRLECPHPPQLPIYHECAPPLLPAHTHTSSALPCRLARPRSC